MRTVTISFKPYMVCEYKHNGRIITNQKKYLCRSVTDTFLLLTAAKLQKKQITTKQFCGNLQ